MPRRERPADDEDSITYRNQQRINPDADDRRQRQELAPCLLADGERLHDQLPHSRIDILDCGHNAWEEDAARYCGVVTAWINGGFREV
jgi:pimeloyl-ACP methyl ester carboxylesterase